MIPGTKSSLYVEEFFEFSDKLSGQWRIQGGFFGLKRTPLLLIEQ